jgi:hypothetical protein
MYNYRWIFIVIIAIATTLFAVPVFSDEEAALCEPSTTGEGKPCPEEPASSYPSAAHLYKTDYKPGSLAVGQSMIYPFAVSEERTYLEWIVLFTNCTSNEPPTMMEVDTDDVLPCAAEYNLSIYQDCDPSILQCTPSFSSIGSTNAYIGIPSPQTGSMYYAEVEAISGSGQYNLITRSYSTESES